ncbi:MFS transporter [Polynucleobacter paneuropaeus]|jgi:ACS family D-galactonate transporter-like MFS transporter|uniref:MFS transporter n=1 Tax=Polynucleobacter paneuropaeus TaxID=2527775 RepID=UPI001BFD9C82|nr:MFS transporter [Polynucleobacter paneuropaeus]MBT8541264.1 MFS transporter [Polynucleobacter paneuropaeus]MBT8566539.1 MFS transporter [Polynucleobacter paneuropaeus]MBT8575848.1 MFS transporter [Polynucleobacter paneuropaeus]MBT8631701.1 MFS transporter [Polynucleobacter paneuropaeus]QWD16738.1 MFS transporter [Polynucleobacter paneuropaeus]
MKGIFKTRHLILGVICLMYFITYIDRVNISVAGPMIKQEFGLTATQLGIVFSAFAYPYAAMQIIGGWCADRFGPRIVLTILSIIWAVATILCGFAWGVTSLLIFRFILGIGEGGAFPTATRAFTFWLPATERGFAQGITHSFARLGGAVTPPIVLGISMLYGWRESFIILGVISLAWTVLYVWYFRDTPITHKGVSEQELKEIAIDTKKMRFSPSVTKKTPWAEMIRKMWLVTFVDFCYGWSLWVFLTWLPSYLKDARGFDLKQLALFTALPLMAGVIGDTLGGVVSDQILKRTGNLKLARRIMLIIGMGGSLIFILPVVSVSDPITAVALLSASFFFLELTNAVLWSLPLDIAGSYAGTAGGMMNTGFGVAGMISPVAFGYLIETTGSYQVPFFVSAVLLGVGVIASLFIDPTNKLADS